MTQTLRALAGAALVATAAAATDAAAATVGFTGDYDVSNWTTSSSSATVGGSVDTTGAPNSIMLIEPDANETGWIEFSITPTDAGRVSFSWSIGGTDSDYGSSELNFAGAITTLGTAVGETGTFNNVVDAGELFGFRSYSNDGDFGSMTLTITDFAVAPVPVPAALPLLLTAFGGLALVGRRRRTARAA